MVLVMAVGGGQRCFLIFGLKVNGGGLNKNWVRLEREGEKMAGERSYFFWVKNEVIFFFIKKLLTHRFA